MSDLLGPVTNMIGYGSVPQKAGAVLEESFGVGLWDDSALGEFYRIFYDEVTGPLQSAVVDAWEAE